MALLPGACLSPRCTEDRFWGNYFYRVALIMQSSEASATTATQETTPDTTNATDTDNTVPPTPTSSTDADADNDPVVEDKDLPDPLASLPEAAALPVVDLAELGGAAQPTPQTPEAESNAAPHASTVAEAAESEDSEGDVGEGDPDGDDEDWEKELAAELDNFEVSFPPSTHTHNVARACAPHLCSIRICTWLSSRNHGILSVPCRAARGRSRGRESHRLFMGGCCG